MAQTLECVTPTPNPYPLPLARQLEGLGGVAQTLECAARARTDAAEAAASTWHARYQVQSTWLGVGVGLPGASS